MRPSLTYEIETGPSGPEFGALFDLDGTVVAGFSALALLRDRLMGGQLDIAGLADLGLGAVGFRQGGVGFAALMRGMARALRGTEERELELAGRRVFREQLAAAIFPDVRRLIEAHLERGHTVAIVTAATCYQADPVADDLGVEHVVCTRLESDGGVLTGLVRGPICYGEGKRDAAAVFAQQRGVDLAKSWFYTDGREDVPLLEAVSRPRPTNPDRELERMAFDRGWPVQSFECVEPAKTSDVLRTLLLTSLIPSAAGVVAASALGGGGRSLLELPVKAFGGVAAAIGGVDLEVQGSEHLAGMPAVFVFNHASAIDMLLIARVVPQPVVPLLRGRGESLWLRALDAVYGGAVLIEPIRSGSLRAIDAAVALLAEGVSIVAAPEDSKTPTPRLSPFRSSPFRVAFEAGVPVVPVVIHNSRDVLPSGGLAVRPGTVAVEVLEPIQTIGWSEDSLQHEIDDIHSHFARALARRAHRP